MILSAESGLTDYKITQYIMVNPRSQMVLHELKRLMEDVLSCSWDISFWGWTFSYGGGNHQLFWDGATSHGAAPFSL